MDLDLKHHDDDHRHDDDHHGHHDQHDHDDQYDHHHDDHHDHHHDDDHHDASDPDPWFRHNSGMRKMSAPGKNEAQLKRTFQKPLR